MALIATCVVKRCSDNSRKGERRLYVEQIMLEKKKKTVQIWPTI